MRKKKHTLSHIRKEKLIALIASYLDREMREIETAYIHGSYMKDEPFSDIDMGIIANSRIEDVIDYELGLEIALEKMIGYPLDVRLLNSAPLSFCQRVIKEGKIVLDRNPSGRADFEGLTLKKYFDFYSFRRRYLEDVNVAPV